MREVDRSSLRHLSSRPGMVSCSGFPQATLSNNMSQEEGKPPRIVSRIQSKTATLLAAAAAAGLPCTVKLQIWPHDIKDPCSTLDPKKCCLTIPHAVLCSLIGIFISSEMGAHFSPCGDFSKLVLHA